MIGTWIPASDDQFFLYDWSIRNGVPMTLTPAKPVLQPGTRAATNSHVQPPRINGMDPFDPGLHVLVQSLKADGALTR